MLVYVHKPAPGVKSWDNKPVRGLWMLSTPAGEMIGRLPDIAEVASFMRREGGWAEAEPEGRTGWRLTRRIDEPMRGQHGH